MYVHRQQREYTIKFHKQLVIIGNICYWKIMCECESATKIYSLNQNALNFFMTNAEWPVKVNE